MNECLSQDRMLRDWVAKLEFNVNGQNTGLQYHQLLVWGVGVEQVAKGIFELMRLAGNLVQMRGVRNIYRYI
jgi:hypothetical protein